MSKSYTRPRSWVFRIKLASVTYFWTGHLDRDGKCERSAHRADAYKFNNSHAALLCADTHDELRDSTEWKLTPLHETPIRKLENASP
jgi:hypothetical protein